MRNRLALAGVAGTLLLVGIALLVNRARPRADVARATAEEVKGTGRCVECHRVQTPAIVRQWQDSRHAVGGVSCFDCHAARTGVPSFEHNGFTLARAITAGTCERCHRREYAELQRSRHAAAAWTAVRGNADFTAAQLEEARRYHPEAIDRPPHPLVALEGAGALESGCGSCHEVGRPNVDGSVGDCTKCHGRHAASVAMSRTSDTCGSCHMGPDHSQIEIWRESRHGVMFVARRDKQELSTPPDKLTAWNQDTPTCSTCHFSGLGGVGSTHDVGQRLSYYLFQPVSEKRPNFETGRGQMKAICQQCHASSSVKRFYEQADVTLAHTNDVVKEAQSIVEDRKSVV